MSWSLSPIRRLSWWLYRFLPLPALMGAITFIAMGFVFLIFASPAVAMVPMLLILVAYASRVQLPMRIPGGLVAEPVHDRHAGRVGERLEDARQLRRRLGGHRRRAGAAAQGLEDGQRRH